MSQGVPLLITNLDDVLEDDIGDDAVLYLPTFKEETLNVFVGMLSSDDGVQRSSNPIPHKIVVHVVIFRGYKSTLVGQLKGNPSSSMDKLRATSHTRAAAHDHCKRRALIG